MTSALLRSRSIVRCGLTNFQRAKIRRLASETVSYVWQNYSAVDRSGTRLESKIVFLRPVDCLNLFEIGPVESRNIDEHVVVDSDTVDVLPCRRTVFRERWKSPCEKRRVRCPTTLRAACDQAAVIRPHV